MHNEDLADVSPKVVHRSALETAIDLEIALPSLLLRPGIEAAREKYVFLCNQDDLLQKDALQQLTAFADQYESNMVVTRVSSTNPIIGQPSGGDVFSHNRWDIGSGRGLVFGSLRPQKLYRRSNLQEAGLRFEEGQQRLDSHLFVAQAYLRAETVSVYADHPLCEVDRAPKGETAAHVRDQTASELPLPPLPRSLDAARAAM